MSELMAEIGLRLLKALGAALIGAVIYLIATVPLGAAPGVELALLCWLSGAAFLLLMESSPL